MNTLVDDRDRSSAAGDAAPRHQPAAWAASLGIFGEREPFWRLRFGALARHPDDGWRLADPMWWPPATRRAFAGLCRALCPPPPAPAGEALYERIEDDVRRSMRYMHPLFALGMLGAMHALELAPLLLRRRLARLSDLPRDEADALLDEVAAHPLGQQLVFAARMAILSMYFDQHEVHEAIDYHPVPFMAERVRARSALLEAEARGRGASVAPIGPWSPVTHAAREPLDDAAAAAIAAGTTIVAHGGTTRDLEP